MLQDNIHSKVAMLMVINIILLIAGTFIDTTSAIVIFAPLFIPICKAMNVDLVHFGMIMTVNLTIGMCTPPLGVCLFVSSSIAKISLKDQMRDLLPMLAVLIGVLLLVTYIPGLTLWLPSLFSNRTLRTVFTAVRSVLFSGSYAARVFQHRAVQ